MKKKLLFAVAMMLAAVGAKAQTDVTSTYLTNADFSQGTPVTVGVCTYVKDKDGNHTEYANLVPVDGWTAVESKDGKAGGLFALPTDEEALARTLKLIEVMLINMLD